MVLTPPQNPLQWVHTPDDIVQLTKEAIDQHRLALDKIVDLNARNADFNSVFLALAEAETIYEAITTPLTFYQNVSPSQEIRDASTEADSLVRDYQVEFSMRIDIYSIKAAAQGNLKESGAWDSLTPEEQRLVEKMILEGHRNGLSLPDEQKNELANLKKELSQACLEFDKNLNEENGYITLTAEELRGIPEDDLTRYTKHTEGGTDIYNISFKRPDIMPIFKFVENPDVRKHVQEIYDSRLPVNVILLEKILGLRRRIAKLIGYKSWADYVTELNVARTAQNVSLFLGDLEARLKPNATKEIEVLLQMKKEEHSTKGFYFDGKFYWWDREYYMRLSSDRALQVEGDLIKEYFPVTSVVSTILEIYQDLLGVKFEESNDSSVWHPDVRVYAVWEKDAREESDFLGFCYLDLYPRLGKYPRDAMFSIQRGYALHNSGGKRAYPVCAMVANLAKPTPDKPALLDHGDVVLFFHEMGHAFHELLSRTEFARFHGPNAIVSVDFAEAPSQMLENWCWEPRILERMSSHYKTKQRLPENMIEKLVKSRYNNVGMYWLWLVFVSKFDLKVHTDQEPEDYTKLWANMQKEIALMDYDKETPAQAAFGHLIGYDAAFYGYAYSLSFAMDMYATVFKEDPLDPVRGKLYRDTILRPGAARDELDCLKDFLGRPPNSKAFTDALFGAQ